jgi:hypothetical protein
MATQIQIRRGLASAWTFSNPTLAQGEFGYEIDTGKYKLGDGLTVWTGLAYASVLPTAYATALEQAATDANGYADSAASTALQDAKDYTDTAVSAVSTTSGVSEGSNLYFTVERAQDAVGNSLGNGLKYVDSTGVISPDLATNGGLFIDNANKLAADPTYVTFNGAGQTLTNKTIDTANNNITVVTSDISDITAVASELNVLDGITATTTELNYTSGVTSAIQTQINAKAPIANPTFTGTVSGITKAMVGLNNVNNTSDANKPISTATQTALDLKAPLADPTFTGTVVLPSTTSIGSVSATELGYVDGVTSAIQTQLNAKAPSANPTFTGTLTAAAVTITGDLTVSGTTTTVNSQNLAVTDSLIYLAKNQYSADTLDIGIYGAYGNSGTNGGNHPHTGLIRDASDGKWKLISGGAEPSDSEVDFTTATKDTLVIGALDATSATIGNVSNTELQYLDGVTSAIQTQIDAKAPSANPTFTGTVSGITKSMVGLGSVDNTSDASKPISTATQTALDLKAPLAAPTFTGAVVLPSTTTIGSVTGTELGYLSGVTSAIQTQISAKLASATAASTYAALTASQTITGTQTFTPAATTAQAVVVKGLSSQTANLQEWQNSSGTAVAKISNAGKFTAIVIDGGTA